VAALIDYYSRVSLREYNYNLDLCLTTGISKFKFGKTSDWTLDRLYTSFHNAFTQFENMIKKCENLEDEIQRARENLNDKIKANEAFNQIIEIYREQQRVLEQTIASQMLIKSQATSSLHLLAGLMMPKNNQHNTIDEIQTEQNEKMQTNESKTKLNDRINEFVIKQLTIDSEIIKLKKIINDIQAQIDVLRPELDEMRKRRENYHMWLVQRGENDDKIQTVLKSIQVIKIN
jgi:chromosome segregation ATPase